MGNESMFYKESKSIRLKSLQLVVCMLMVMTVIFTNSNFKWKNWTSSIIHHCSGCLGWLFKDITSFLDVLINPLKHWTGCRYVIATMYTNDEDVVLTKLVIYPCWFHSIFGKNKRKLIKK